MENVKRTGTIKLEFAEIDVPEALFDKLDGINDYYQLNHIDADMIRHWTTKHAEDFVDWQDEIRAICALAEKARIYLGILEEEED
jgi:hypothetical protein